MRQLFGGALLASLFLCTGCVLFTPPDGIAKMQPKEEAIQAPPPVLPEHVTPEDWASVMQRLWDETDRDYQRVTTNSPRK